MLKNVLAISLALTGTGLAVAQNSTLGDARQVVTQPGRDVGIDKKDVPSVLAEAADERHLARTIARYGRVDLLLIDELGYLQLDRRGAELLFQVLTEREERSAVAIASNEPFSGWTKTFTDPRLCAAIVDRLTFAGQIIDTGTTSYRLNQARRRRSGDPS